jgi:hypothetical protein
MSLQALAEVIQKLKEIELDMGAAIARADKALGEAGSAMGSAMDKRVMESIPTNEKAARTCKECGKELPTKRGRAPKLCAKCKQVETLRKP